MATANCTRRVGQAPAPKPTRKPRTVKPAHGVARLTLEIDGTRYRVKPLSLDRAAGVSRLVQLRKLDGSGEVYHASQHRHGAECTCPSWVFDKDGTGESCKHLAALQAIGLMPPAFAPGHASTWPSWCDEIPYGLTADAEQADRQARFRAATATDAFTAAALARAVEEGVIDPD